MFYQIIVPFYMPMPTGAEIPAEDTNVALLVVVGFACFLIGFLVGMLIEHILNK